MSGRAAKYGLAAATLLASGFALAARAEAAVYCTRPGIPAGCVVRPTGAPGVGVLPGAGAGAAGVGVAPGVGVGAPGVGTQPMNRGGPVNRLGVR